ncbi:hypothetical protein K7711_31930 [Nocardia sp. CA2R105]|uniref:hypothetical protein n=1 Tax=Nocardia coffeae TaxID=2873381 RepID=UPI001CA7141B|nr:hypothetical protein [Nocardia coffeae]MBY8861124.1 hypothetical protein [Nocardia coffeae]
MSPRRNFGGSDPPDDEPGDHDSPDHPDHPPDSKENPNMLPEPLDPDDAPAVNRAIEAPKPTTHPDDAHAPSAGQLHAMFPDAFPKNTPERRERHLTAVPDSADLDTLPADLDPDEADDPLIAAALRWRALMTFWWRPAATVAVVVVIGVVAFFATGIAVGIAWCIYGVGWTGHSVWTAHGRPSLRHLAHTRGSGW